MTMFDIPWEMDFASDEDYMEFVSIYEEKILFDINSQVHELHAALVFYPTFWLVDEDIFSKLLYTLRPKLVKDSLKKRKLLYNSCLKMLYYANIYYKCGLIKAPIMAFIEVYRLIFDYYRTEGW
ncbi:hypothetical protein AVEN_63468-1 [Araneus ventricosus]|uniref:Uncharacterized protein n=1 Tax=Araneus ventricosus TaxID=182803 RepID=A0A4Y2CRE1_ARAVE|nr:hypothetical protein AVEN_63468-1 [Araneus ventricosus]